MLVGRDTRYSSPMLHSAVLSGLLSAGCEVLDLGICPTPILQFFVSRERARGALSISGGHNGTGWNAITLIGADGAVLEPVAGETVLDGYHSRDFLRQSARQIGRVQEMTGYTHDYMDALCRKINVEAIRAAGFKVLMDPVGGAGCLFCEAFTEFLGLCWIPLNAEPSGYLPRHPEPRPRNALQAVAIARHMRVDAGFVFSSDMGRCSLVTEQGEPVSEEYTFALASDHVLSRKVGPLITNNCTTRTVDDIARRRGATVIKTRVGQSHVLQALADHQGVIGGEGSGSVAYPAFQMAFDGFVVMALILESMAEQDRTLSDLLAAIPRYHITKRSLPCASRDAYRAMEAIQQQKDFIGDALVDTTDGCRMDWADRWLHVRPSRTQQLVRVIVEGPDAEVVDRCASEALHFIEQAI